MHCSLNLACWLFRRKYKAYNVSLTFIEQQFSQIEKQLISCNAKLESEEKQHERLQKEHDETGKVIKSIQIYSPIWRTAIVKSRKLLSLKGFSNSQA